VPYAYRIFPDIGLVVTRGIGTVSGAELVAHARALAADPRHDPANKHLIDLTDASRAQVGTDDFVVLKSLLPFSPESRRAAVAPSDLMFGMVRMAMSIAEVESDLNSPVRSMAEASAFLSIPRIEQYAGLAREQPDWLFDSSSERPG
jgi:hypothetical protein